MDFCKHHNALNTVYQFLYGKTEQFGAYKVASMFYYQDYETRAYEQLDAFEMSRNIAIQCDDPQCIKEMDIEIARIKQLINMLNDNNGQMTCH